MMYNIYTLHICNKMYSNNAELTQRKNQSMEFSECHFIILDESVMFNHIEAMNISFLDWCKKRLVNPRVWSQTEIVVLKLMDNDMFNPLWLWWGFESWKLSGSSVLVLLTVRMSPFIGSAEVLSFFWKLYHPRWAKAQGIWMNQVILLVAKTPTTDGWSRTTGGSRGTPPPARWVLQTTGRMACPLSASWFFGTGAW